MHADEYCKLAEVEDRMWYFRALHGHIERALTEALGVSSASVLDAGCGTGGLIRRLAPKRARWRWTGIDVSDLACQLARERVSPGNVDLARPAVPETQIVHGSITSLPFEAAQFDAIVSADVLYHVDEDEAALREFARVLRPGGVVVLNVPAYRWLWSYHDVAVQSRRRYDRAEVTRKLEDGGFVVRASTYWNTLPFPLVVLRRKLLPAPKSGSDVQLYSAPIETMFAAAMALERTWLRAVGPLPFGSSVFAVAQKR